MVSVCALMLAVAGAAHGQEHRTISGQGNNLQHPTWGMTSAPLLRGPSGANYADGIGEMLPGPSPRAVSNALSQQVKPNGNAKGLTSFMWQWGQFIDHDIALIFEGFTEPVQIPVPKGDPIFDPGSTGTASIHMLRSRFVNGVTTPREHLSGLTHFIDASMVYGSDDSRANDLRTFEDGRLRTSPGEFLPKNMTAQPNVPSPDPKWFLAGDVRANEQVGLTSLHTLFVREHNWWAARIKAEHPTWNDEQIYQHARRMVGGEISTITYNEWLPLLLGPFMPDPYAGYDPDVNPGIRTEFSSAAFRIGHTLLNEELKRYDENGNVYVGGHLTLRDAFFAIGEVTAPDGFEAILRGLALQEANEVDPQVVDSVRNFLFTILNPQGLDLISLNLQRGRDHGIPRYNQLRMDYGLPPRAGFNEISSDPQIAGALASVYVNVDEVDAWIGMMAEDHMPGAMMGETVGTILKDQFQRLRDGDRFYMHNDPAMSQQEILEIEATRLSDIIRRNSNVKNIQLNVFMMPEKSCYADCDGSGLLDLFDFLCFQNAFNLKLPQADCDGSGQLDLFDFLCFVTAFNAGCP